MSATTNIRVPAELTTLRQWHCWKLVDGTKIPVQVTGQTAKSNDPKTWTDFETADAASVNFSGLAFEITAPYCGIDLDNCLDENGLRQWVWPILNKFAGLAYAEVSPSRNGIKLITRARKIDGARCVHKIGDDKQQIECYDGRRFWTITQDVYNSQREIRDGQAAVDWLCKEYLTTKPQKPQNAVTTSLVVPMPPMDELERRLQGYAEKVPAATEGERNNSAFRLAGNLAAIDDNGHRPTESQVLRHVSQWNGKNVEPLEATELESAVRSGMTNGTPREPKPSNGMAVVDPSVDLSGITSQAPGHSETTEDTDDETKPIPFEGIDIVELEQFADEQPDWIVDGIFSADQPTLFGARSKCLKTTQLIDMSVALASGTPWLTSFNVAKRRRVLFITGESNYRAASRRLRKACQSRINPQTGEKLTFRDISGMLRIEAVNFPKLPRREDCEHIKRVIDRHHPDVVIIDPLYRGLTADIDPHKMSQVGEAIVYFAHCCQPAALFISHHVVKSSARELGAPPELEDMNGAGIAESCGNWWLVGRNEKYQWDWQHDLCVQFGGRDEQGGARRIVFNESTWTSEVENYRDFIGGRQEAAEKAQDEKKRDSHQRKIEQARLRIMTAMRNKKAPRSKRAIEDLRGAVPQTAFREAFADMVTDQTICVRSYRDGQNRLQSEGYLLAEYTAEYEQQFQLQEDAR